jgi:glucose/arabinose dehydrogenase
MKFQAALILALAGLSCGDWVSNNPYFAQNYINIAGPRGLLLDNTGDLLVVSGSGVSAVYEENNSNGTINVVSVRIVNGVGRNLNHGIAYNGGYLYVSSPTTVFRWPYTPGQRQLVTAQAETVINGIPNGGHTTRTLIFDSEGLLYVSCGSNANVDSNSDRARIRRFSIQGNFPISFDSGEVSS